MVTSASVDVDEEAARVAGSPSFLGINVLDDPETDFGFGNMSTAIEWRTSGSASSGSDITDSAFPTSNVDDRNAHTFSAPDEAPISALPDVFLIMAVEPGTDDDHTLNTIAFKPINFDLAPSTIRIFVRIADQSDPNFASSELVLSRTSISTNEWIVATVLTGAGTEYTDFGLIRLEVELESGSWGGSFAPQIGQVIVGKRRQIGFNFLTPFDDEPRISSVTDFMSNSGVLSRHILHKGKNSWSLLYNPTNSNANQTGIEEVDNIRAWFADTDFGTLNFLFVDQPATTPPRGHWVFVNDPELVLPLRGPFDRGWSTGFTELPPFETDP